jgi:hypothetical protein
MSWMLDMMTSPQSENRCRSQSLAETPATNFTRRTCHRPHCDAGLAVARPKMEGPHGPRATEKPRRSEAFADR